MIAGYLRERFRLRIYVPAALAIAGAAATVAPEWTLLARDAGFALLLLAQFRLWDDLADRERDAVVHPERTLVRAADVAQPVAFCGALAILNICVAVWRDASGLAVGALAMVDAVFAVCYLASRGASALGDQVRLTKYPAFVLIVAGERALAHPWPVIGAAVVVYAGAWAYEVWHDPGGPLGRLVLRGGRS